MVLLRENFYCLDELFCLLYFGEEGIENLFEIIEFNLWKKVFLETWHDVTDWVDFQTIFKLGSIFLRKVQLFTQFVALVFGGVQNGVSEGNKFEKSRYALASLLGSRDPPNLGYLLTVKFFDPQLPRELFSDEAELVDFLADLNSLPHRINTPPQQLQILNLI